MVIAPLASISNVDESISIATSDVVPILIPPAPSMLNAPAPVSYTHLPLPTIYSV